MWQYNYTDNLYNNSDELYHYGILGMKWKNHIYKTTYDRMTGDRQRLKSMNSDYDWMVKNNNSIKRKGGKIANSRLLTNIRNKKINKLKNKMNIYRDSIKEDNEILNNLSKKGVDAKKQRNIVRTKNAMKNAKMKMREANEKFNNKYDDAYNYSSRYFLSQFINKNRRKESDRRWNDTFHASNEIRRAKDEYKKAKKAYKNAKRK